MSLRSNRPAPAPPSGASKQLKRQIFNSFVSKSSQDTNNNFKILSGPTVIRPTGAVNQKKKPPPRPAPPKNFQTSKNVSQPPDLLADLHDIFGPPLVQTVKSNQSVLPPRLSSQRWKKAPAPKPSAAAIKNAKGTAIEQLSLIDFDTLPAPPSQTAEVFKNQAVLDFLTSDAFDKTSSNVNPFNASSGSVFRNNSPISTNAFQTFSNQAPNYFMNNSSVSIQPPSNLTSLSSSKFESVFSTSDNSWEKNKPRLSVFSPPEPKFPPPPPPESPLANDKAKTQINSGNDDVVYCRSLFDFQAADSEELSFCVGEKIILIEQVSADWWRGSLGSKSGLFPSSYVEIDLNPTSSVQIGHNLGPTSSEANNVDQKGCFVIALYDFEAEQSQDLSFLTGDTIEVLYRMNQNWLFGKCSDGREGQFPANFVQKPANSHGMTCIAKHQFKAENRDELSLEVGQTIVILEKVSSDWWKGYHNNDYNKKEGLFPSAFVQEEIS